MTFYRRVGSIPPKRHTQHRDSAGRLLGVGICDRAPHSLSSVYFYFDPSESKRSLGTFAALAKPAQHAVATVVRSFAEDALLTEAERDLSTALFVLASALG